MPMTTGAKVAIGVFLGVPIVIMLGIVIAVMYASSKLPATGASGGYVPKDSPVANLPATSTIPAYQAAVAAPPAPVNQTKYVRLRKDMGKIPIQTQMLSPGEVTFQVSEIKVYADGILLPKSAFSDISFTKGGVWNANYPADNILDGNRATFATTANVPQQEITATLRDPANVTSVEVYNRLDCCQARLAGTQVILDDVAGRTLWTSPMLTSADAQTLAPVYTSGFQGMVSRQVMTSRLRNAVATR